MKRKIWGTRALKLFVLIVLVLLVGMLGGAVWQAQAQDAKTKYPNMAAVDEYLMERDAEIALARSAAVDSISRDAEVMVLGRHGYETAVKGKNGFLCVVERSWTAPSDDANFWNPKLRGAICFNPTAARTYFPLTIKKSELVLAGRSKAEMFEGIKNALDKKEIPAVESGAMCYMLSKQSYLSDSNPHWHPHIMIFAPPTDPAAWGANAPGSGVIGFEDPEDRMTVFMIPVTKWSDGTDAPSYDDH